MRIHTGVHKNLIAISVISTLLIFWLGTVFWLEAFHQRSGAAQLRMSTKPESALFALANSLGQERAYLHTMLAIESSDPQVVDSYEQLKNQSDQLFDKAIDQIRASRNTPFRFVEHRYTEESVEQLIFELLDGMRKISQSSSSIFLQKLIPLSQRDNDMRMQLFDAYGTLIQQVNSLRLRTHFLPEKNYQEVLASHSLKNSIWNLSESTSQISALLESYLIKRQNGSLEQVRADGLLFRVFQQARYADQAIFAIEEFAESTNDASILDADLHAVISQYKSQYVIVKQRLTQAIPVADNDSISLAEWQRLSLQVSNQVERLTNDTIDRTIDNARKVEAAALKSLAIDSMLVLVCLAMAVSSTTLARRVQYQATHDELTGLPNRRYFGQQLGQSIEKANLSSASVALLTIDLNRFKSINDSMGHAIGDALLKMVSARLHECTDERMCIARLGGDEFSLFFIPHSPAEVQRLAGNILETLENPFTIEQGVLKIGASIGISLYPQDADSAGELQVTSDYAMFFAKRQGKLEGKSIVQAYNREMAEEFENRLRTEHDLALAIETDQLELYYQPQYNLAQNRVDAVEALLRWNHPQRGMVSPVEFISVAEECGLMPALGSWVLNEACRQAAQWKTQTNLGLRVAINVSVHQIMQPAFVQDVLLTLERHHLSADAIEIELTESVFVSDSEWVSKSLQQLSEAGIKIALDDFGTGYSSLSRLQDLPINTLKIDRSFIAKLDGPSDISQSVTASIASIAGVLGLETVAEGVESDWQLDQISGLGINMVQGFLYSRPVSSDQVPGAIDNLNSDPNGFNKAA